jgi:hypothetical protein
MQQPSFGPWIVERPIGRGAHATVYRCHHHQDPRLAAAVKVLHSAEPRQVARLAREVRVLRRLDHPGIVSVLDADPGAAEPWVALELVDGAPLDPSGRGARPAAEVAAVARQVGAALAHAHAVGVFHRDVKPANLLVERRTGRVRVVDFGISAARGESTLTDPGAAAPGTVDYAPPEWFRSLPHELDPARLDAYALGVVLYELLAGGPAFPVAPGASVGRMLAAKVATPELDPGEGTPEPLRSVVRALTAAEPRRRATIEEVLGALAETVPAAERRSAPALVSVPADAFVGREEVLAALGALPPTVRLVTLTGPPGVGKSRLAREWCAATGPTPWVELGEVSDLPGALRAAGRALPCAPTLDAVTAGLRDGEWSTVLLDDADRVLDALREILPAAFRGTPRVRWVVTARRRLRIGGERVIAVEPLPVPLHDEPTAAVALLGARIRESDGVALGPREAAALARAVDGLPLALEVAASAPPGVGALEHDAGEDALRGVLSAAWDRLDPESRRVAGACAVFRAPFPLPLAEDVIGPGERPLFEVLQGLVDQSWLQVRRGEGAFAMLRPLRAFAERQGLDPDVRLRHAFAAARAADRSAAPAAGEVAEALAAWDWAEAEGDRDLAVSLALVVARGTGAREGAWVARARGLLAGPAGSADDRDRLSLALGG